LTDEHGHIVYKRVGCDYLLRGKSLTDKVVAYRTGENYTDDGSDVSEATLRPKVVHLGQYTSNGSVVSSLGLEGLPLNCSDRYRFQAVPLFRDQYHQ